MKLVRHCETLSASCAAKHSNRDVSYTQRVPIFHSSYKSMPCFQVLNQHRSSACPRTSQHSNPLSTAHITTMSLPSDVLQLQVASWDWIGFPLAFYDTVSGWRVSIRYYTTSHWTKQLTTCAHPQNHYQAISSPSALSSMHNNRCCKWFPLCEKPYAEGHKCSQSLLHPTFNGATLKHI
jgi:hypothetical protein